ncbi:putative photosynthetic complex assembly protein PuhE [Litorisediminicola beolgyonensis]|uniref:Photosynthetic complex assembly protein PuhE n=1 Tax=Litorisediminicola beolgyonensis TaxID=1173614 RepID=A0ABW3ZHE0_9RHOB
MLSDPWIGALVALFAWWFSTGAILALVRWADREGRGAFAALAATPLLAFGAWGVLASATMQGPVAIYLGFLSALALWGWIELAFLTGVMTGPNTRICPPNRPEWERFLRAWGTIAYHEMALAAMLIALGLHAQGAANQLAFWTFAVLFFARVSAQVNLFLGVPKFQTEFLPRALAHLPSHFRQAPLNWLFPISVTALSFAMACWLERLWGASDPMRELEFALLAAITALALLEHWFLVLPLPDEKLWRWMLPAPGPRQETTEDSHGL